MMDEAILTGELVTHDPATTRWLELVDSLLHNLRSAHSRRAYAGSLRQFFAWVQTAPPAVTTRQIIAYRDLLQADGKQAATVNRHLAAIRALYAAAVVEGLMTRNPAVSVKTLETAREGVTPALTQDEVQTLLHSIDQTTLLGLRDYALILLLARTGLRRDEVVRLHVTDLAQQQGHWTLKVRRKGGTPGLIKVPADVYRALMAWLDAAQVQDEALWHALMRHGRGAAMRYRVGNALTADGLLKLVQRRAKQAGITTPLTPHVFRATFITLALDGGAPLHKVQYAAGHADPRTTERYHRSKQNLDNNAVDYLHFN